MKKIGNIIGIEDFKEIKENFFYVDKTRFLVNIISSLKGSVFLYTRPRRFGKSLMLSMVDYFFNDKKNTQELFSDLYISSQGEKYIKEINTKKVIRLNLNRLNATTYEEFLILLGTLMSNIYYGFFNGKIEEIPSHLRDKVSKYIDNKASEIELKESFGLLLDLVYVVYGVDALVLIDEYDSPIMDSLENGYFDKSISFMKKFFGDALKGHSHLWRAILTGVNQIAHTSIFSDINNLSVNNVLTRSEDEYFGFTKEETRDILSYYEFNGDLKKVEEMYGGYSFGLNMVYSPWSILSFINSNFQFEPYWISTGTYSYIKDIIKIISDNQIQSLVDLVNGESIISPLKQNITFNNGVDLQNLFTQLVFTGYLTAIKVSNDGKYLLNLPNEEIRIAFSDEILSLLNNDDSFLNLAKIKYHFVRGDEVKLSEILKSYLMYCILRYNLTYEEIYQLMILNLSSIMVSDAIVRSEVNAGKGRCDILLKSRNNKEFAIIIEIKHLKGRKSIEDIEKSANVALNQIKEMEYIQEVIDCGYKNIQIYGMAFNKNNVRIKNERIDY